MQKNSADPQQGAIVRDGQAARDPFGERTEMLAHALADRLQRLETGGARMGVDADAFS